MLCALPVKTAFVAAMAASLAPSLAPSAINKNHSNTATPAAPPASGEQAKHCGRQRDEREAPLPRHRRRRRRRRRPRDYRAGCYTHYCYTTLASFVSIERRDARLSLLARSLRSLFRWLRTLAKLKGVVGDEKRIKRGRSGVWIWKTSDFVVEKGGEFQFPSRLVASENNKSLVS